MRSPHAGLAAVLLCAGLITTIATPPASPASAATTVKAVQWTLDEKNKQIIVTVKLQFWNEYNCYSTTSGGAKCSTSPTPPTTADVQRIVDGILRYWNGHKFKCWDFVVRITASSLADAQSADPDAADIGLVDTPVHVTPYVLGTRTTGHYLGTAPGDRTDPVRDPGQVDADWPTRATAPDHVYAHEFGHILGLDDNYEEEHGHLLPGATPDLMWGQSDASRAVSEDMITRAVLRSGKIDVSKIKCKMTANAGPTTLNLILASLDDLAFHVYTCDYDPPTSDPANKPKPMNWKGTIHLAGSYLTQISIPGFPGGSGAIDVPTSFTAQVPVTGEGFLYIPASSDVVFQVPVNWGADGLLHPTQPALLSSSGGTLSTLYFFPGPPLMATFTSTAPECP